MALELWAVKVLYLYAHSRLVEHAVKEAGRKALGMSSFRNDNDRTGFVETFRDFGAQLVGDIGLNPLLSKSKRE